MTAADVEDDATKRAKKDGVWLMVLGALALVLGVVGLFMTFGLTLVSTLWYGALLAVVGVAHIFFALKEKRSRWLNLLLGMVYLVAGILILANPLGAVIGLTLLIGIALAVIGVARVVWSFRFPGFPRKLLGVLGGLISVLLGWMILANWPWTGLWVLGLFIATDLILYGLTMIGVGWRRR